MYDNCSVSSDLHTAVSRFARLGDGKTKKRDCASLDCGLHSLRMGDAHDERAAACAPGAAQSGGRAPSACARAARDRAIEAQSTAAAPHSLGLSFNVYGNISTTAPLLNNVRTQLTHASSGSAGACLLNFYDDFVFSPPPGSGSSTVGAIMHDCSVDVTASATSEGTAHPQPAVIARDAAADSTATDPATGSPVTGSPVAVSPVAGSPVECGVADGFFA